MGATTTNDNGTFSGVSQSWYETVDQIKSDKTIDEFTRQDLLKQLDVNNVGAGVDLSAHLDSVASQFAQAQQGSGIYGQRIKTAEKIKILQDQPGRSQTQVSPLLNTNAQANPTPATASDILLTGGKS